MRLPKASRYLLDVNILVALLDEDHVHHRLTTKWFHTPELEWAICAFTEAGFLRYMTRPKTGEVSIEEATAMLGRLREEPGYRYQPIVDDWHMLSRPFFTRLFGHNQITDAYLLGLAVHQGLVLATFDKAILHLAGEHSGRVLLLTQP